MRIYTNENPNVPCPTIDDKKSPAVPVVPSARKIRFVTNYGRMFILEPAKDGRGRDARLIKGAYHLIPFDEKVMKKGGVKISCDSPTLDDKGKKVVYRIIESKLVPGGTLTLVTSVPDKTLYREEVRRGKPVTVPVTAYRCYTTEFKLREVEEV